MYSYNRRTAALTTYWGSAVFEWMEGVCNVTAGELGHATKGRVERARKSSQNGVFATIEDVALSGDLTGKIFVTLDWWKDTVLFKAWIDHPQRGDIDLIKTELGYRSSPDGYIKSALAKVRAV